MARMNAAFLLSLLWLVSFVQCYSGGQGFMLHMEKLIQNQHQRSLDSLIEKSNEEFSPVYVGNQVGLKENDKVSALPGQPKGVNFDQYSGYVTVDPDAGRALFYYFAQSENSSTKPLVMWLGGGPACSSLGYGAMLEIGPFRPNKDGETLWQNPYAWNKVANVLFLDNVPDVGFSYSNKSSGYMSGDKQTAADSYTFLVNWLERFPEYKTRDFYITGETYAGHFASQLANFILQNNKSTNLTLINLKGIAVGNAILDMETIYQGMYDYAFSHALISDEIYEGIVSSCNFSLPLNLSNACNIYMEKANAIIFYNNMDSSNIYAPLCSSFSNNISSISAADPCSGYYVLSYLNNFQVQKSLHVNAIGRGLGPWAFCKAEDWEDRSDTMLPIIKDLMESGIRVWLLSGDLNVYLSVTTTKYVIKKLGISVKTLWYPWNFEGEVGGFVVGHQNLTFVTIKGSGFMIPADQPARALAIFSSFLQGVLPPSRQS